MITVSNDFTALVAYPTELHRQNCLTSCLQADIARKKCPQKVPLTYNRQRGRTVHIRTRPGPLPEFSACGSSFQVNDQVRGVVCLIPTTSVMCQPGPHQYFT